MFSVQAVEAVLSLTFLSALDLFEGLQNICFVLKVLFVKIMPVEVHGTAGSAPCRILYMTCDAVGVEYKRVEVDLMSGGTRTPEYLKVIRA